MSDDRVWGVRHPEGAHLPPQRITVEMGGRPFWTVGFADGQRRSFDIHCTHCGTGVTGHTLVYREVGPWRDE